MTYRHVDECDRCGRRSGVDTPSQAVLAVRPDAAESGMGVSVRGQREAVGRGGCPSRRNRVRHDRHLGDTWNYSAEIVCRSPRTRITCVEAASSFELTHFPWSVTHESLAARPCVAGEVTLHLALPLFAVSRRGAPPVRHPSFLPAAATANWKTRFPARTVCFGPASVSGLTSFNAKPPTRGSRQRADRAH